MSPEGSEAGTLMGYTEVHPIHIGELCSVFCTTCRGQKGHDEHAPTLSIVDHSSADCWAVLSAQHRPSPTYGFRPVIAVQGVRSRRVQLGQSARRHEPRLGETFSAMRAGGPITVVWQKKTRDTTCMFWRRHPMQLLMCPLPRGLTGIGID